MGSVIEEALEVIDQDATSQTMLAKMPFQVIDHPPQGKVHSSVLQTGGVVVDERGGVDWHNAVIT